MSKELIERLRLMAFESLDNDEATMLQEAADALEAKAAPVGEREAFEAWAAREGMRIRKDGEDYCDYVTDNVWQGFQAGAAYQRAQQPQSAEAVAWHTEDHLEDKSATTYSKEIADRWAAKGWPVTPMFYTTPQPSAVADGWKLVPLCVTSGMEDAYDDKCAEDGIEHELYMPAYEAMLAAAPSAPKTDERPLYTCIGKGGEYRYLGTAIGAGDSRGELAEVYQDRTGQLFHRTPEDFMERMEPIAAARKGEEE